MTQTPQLPPPPLTSKQAAEWLRVPLGSLYRWQSQGKGPRRYKIGRECRYWPEDLLAFYNEHLVED